jgi:1,4-dihydroxy-2-naphthoate octaprenyltransferase
VPVGVLGSLLIYVKIIRPHIVAGGFLGYSLGVLFALIRGNKLSPALFALGYAVVLFGDLSTHFSNDYYDVDLDGRAPRKTFGSSYVLVEHPDARPLAKVLALALTTASLLAALSMVLLFGSPPSLLMLVAVTNLFGWLYSAPPVQLNARGLGEATIALGTGFAVPAVGYIATSGRIDPPFLIFSVPLVLYGFILSLSLELPDVEVDLRSGRRNLVVLLGRRTAAFLVFILSVAALAFFTFFDAVNSSHFWAIPLLSSVPVFASLAGLNSHFESHEDADRTSSINIIALCFFLVALDAYLLLELLL